MLDTPSPPSHTMTQPLRRSKTSVPVGRSSLQKKSNVTSLVDLERHTKQLQALLKQVMQERDFVRQENDQLRRLHGTPAGEFAHVSQSVTATVQVLVPHDKTYKVNSSFESLVRSSSLVHVSSSCSNCIIAVAASVACVTTGTVTATTVAAKIAPATPSTDARALLLLRCRFDAAGSNACLAPSDPGAYGSSFTFSSSDAHCVRSRSRLTPIATSTML